VIEEFSTRYTGFLACWSNTVVDALLFSSHDSSGFFRFWVPVGKELVYPQCGFDFLFALITDIGPVLGHSVLAAQYP